MSAPNTTRLTTDADRAIGHKIAALRLAQGLSQAALGHALGVSFQQVHKYETGRNRVGAGRLQAIAVALNVSVEIFFAKQSECQEDSVVTTTVFNDPQVMELVMAFTNISDEAMRSGVLSIVKAASSLRMATAYELSSKRSLLSPTLLRDLTTG